MQTSSRIIGSQRLFDNPRFSVDDTLLYAGLVQSVLASCDKIVDVGCGRGSYADDTGDFQNIFDLRGEGRHVIGLDVDQAASANPFVDEFRQILPGNNWPTESDSADLVVSDWTLEHVEDPVSYIAEVRRTLHVGGVFIARSVSRYSALALISRLVPNRSHAVILSKAQPARREVDIFPTFYRMNSRRGLADLLERNFDYSVASRPGLENYLHARHPFAARTVASIERRLPEPMQTAFVVCARLRAK